MSFDLALEGYDQQRGRQFQLNVLRQVESLPGIQAAGLINSLPLTADQSSTCIRVERRTQRAASSPTTAPSLSRKISKNSFASAA